MPLIDANPLKRGSKSFPLGLSWIQLDQTYLDELLTS
jgi:hypothetical protein